jgi:hypothetical protein
MGVGAGLISHPSQFFRGSGFCCTRSEPDPLPSLVRRCVGEPDPLSLRRRAAEHNRAVEVMVFDTNFIDYMVSNPMLIHSWIISDFEY